MHIIAFVRGIVIEVCFRRIVETQRLKHGIIAQQWGEIQTHLARRHGDHGGLYLHGTIPGHEQDVVVISLPGADGKIRQPGGFLERGGGSRGRGGRIGDRMQGESGQRSAGQQRPKR